MEKISSLLYQYVYTPSDPNNSNPNPPFLSLSRTDPFSVSITSSHSLSLFFSAIFLSLLPLGYSSIARLSNSFHGGIWLPKFLSSTSIFKLAPAHGFYDHSFQHLINISI